MSANRKPAASPATRRDFLKAAGAGAVAVSVGPTILHATDKAGAKAARVGEGAFVYECDHHWGEVPAHIVWGETHGITYDNQGMIYIKHRTLTQEPMDSIAVFDQQGKFVRSFGKEYHQGGHGIDVRTEGGEQFLYLSDIQNRKVVKTNLQGEHVWEKSFPTEPNVYASVDNYRPTNVAFSPDGGFYIADGYGSHYIHQYDKDANWVRTWGGAGSEPGKMSTPHGLWWDDRPGREPGLAVADRANARLQYFTADGTHTGFVQGLSFPANVDLQGEVLLVPDLHARITLMDKDNNIITHLGYDENWTKEVLDGFKMRGQPERWQDGKFIHPHDACFDPAGNIYEVEWVATGRVSKLTKVS